MKILIVTRRFRPLIGGAESVLWQLAREFVQQGHEVHVLTAQWEKAWLRQQCIDGVHILRIPQPAMRIVGTIRYMIQLRHWLLRNREKFDVCYVSMLKHSAWVCSGIGRRVRRPVVLRTEGGGATGDVAWQKKARGGSLIKGRCRRAPALVALSQSIKDEMVASKYMGERIHVIPNGVPVPTLRGTSSSSLKLRAGVDPSSPTVLYTGRLSPEKGVADLIAAWPDVSTAIPNARLVIVGTGPQEGELRDQSAVMDHIEWAGSSTMVSKFLRAADLFVLPSHFEGISISLLEAMAHNVPIVATDIAGNRDLVTSGIHGLLAKAHQPASLSHMIVTQLKSPVQARIMAEAAREKVIEHFSINQMAKRHVELFNTLCAPD